MDFDFSFHSFWFLIICSCLFIFILDFFAYSAIVIKFISFFNFFFISHLFSSKKKKTKKRRRKKNGKHFHSYNWNVCIDRANNITSQITYKSIFNLFMSDESERKNKKKNNFKPNEKRVTIWNYTLHIESILSIYMQIYNSLWLFLLLMKYFSIISLEIIFSFQRRNYSVCNITIQIRLIFVFYRFKAKTTKI